MTRYYHASTSRLPLVLVPKEKYEDASDGCPSPIFGDPRNGFPISKIPEIAFSKNPESAVFAVAQQLAEPPAKPVDIMIYATNAEPDTDLSSCGYDFEVLEEVRYRKPVTVTPYARVHLSKKMVESVGNLYNSNPPTEEEALAEMIRDYKRKSHGKEPDSATLSMMKYGAIEMEDAGVDFIDLEQRAPAVKRAIRRALEIG